MELPKRKSIRLKGYDYSSNGAYFITVCTKNKEALFGKVVPVGADIIRPNTTALLTEYEICLSETGKIIKTAIENINKHYPYATVDKYIIMPNHIHLILFISNDNCKATDGRILSAPTDKPIKTVETIIGQMKRWASKQAGISLWQKSFFDHIIRTDDDYFNSCNYIQANPRRWIEKEYNNI